MDSSRSTQVLVVIPKQDELRAAAAVFGFSAASPNERIDGTYETWRLQLSGLAVQIVLVGDQGVAKIALATRLALAKFDPSVAICVGTAAGREGRTSYLDVVIATSVLDASEWRAVDGGFEPQWEEKPKPTRDALQDIDDFVKSRDWRERCRSWFDNAIATLSSSVDDNVLDGWPRTLDGWVVTTSMLHEDPAFLERIWALHSRLRVVDMETAGFVEACSDPSRRRPWFVVRSVSDYGTRASKQDQLRPAAAAAAAAVSRALIECGLQRAHPLRVDPTELGDSRLSPSNFFSQLTMPSFLSEKLPGKLGVTIDATSLTAELTVNDLASLCARGRPPTLVDPTLDDIREAYFTSKYLDYHDEADVRGLTGSAWSDEVQEAYNFVGVDPSRADILYVGVGTGRDIPLVCPEFKSLTGIDLSATMLARAKQAQPDMVVMRDRAEGLTNVADESVDLYLSLRTYQSSLFDIGAALRQALRVLRGGGSLVLLAGPRFSVHHV